MTRPGTGSKPQRQPSPPDTGRFAPGPSAGSPRRPASRCSVGVNALDPALPVIGTGALTAVRRSRTSKWRAGALIGLHALIAAHITHFLIAGRTLSPLEPSESMYTLELGYVNCGFIFFAVAIGATLVFGRFFCGWACHIVALQDFCAWLMKKARIRPRPFRSRFLAFGPLVLALYMFVWPTFKRLVLGSGAPSPHLTNHLLTSGFWATFPGPVFTVLTFLVCGFAAVYFLGAKGFCTYGCPYGAVFIAADRLSPMKIVVSDACEQCGHCTATCTSNVRVHEEVAAFGHVVDPGCMKCLDCVSVCPKGALSLGFAMPSVFKGAPKVRRATLYDLSLPAEVLLAGVGIVATLAFRGLYDGPPLLMSIGLGAVTAFLAFKLWQLARRPSVRIQNLNLKLGGTIGPAGWIFAAGTLLWLAFTAHSAFVQWHRAWGEYYVDRTEASRADVLSGAFANTTYSSAHYHAAGEALRHLALADSWGLVEVVSVKLGLAWAELLKGDSAAAEANVRQAIAIAPSRPALHQNLSEILLVQGRTADAIGELQDTIRLEPAPTPAQRFQLAGLLAESERFDEAIAEYERFLVSEPDSAEAHYDLGGLLRRRERLAEALVHLRRAHSLAPADPDTLVELGLACMAAGLDREALEHFRRAVELAPDSPESRMHLPGLIQQLEAAHPSASGHR